MRCIRSISVGLLVVCASQTLYAVDPIPESQQAAQATKIIDAYHGTRPPTPPKKLHVVYFTPADREPAANYPRRLQAIVEDIRVFYRDGMVRLGFAPKTFALDHDAEGKLILHPVRGQDPEAAFTKVERQEWWKYWRPARRRAG